MADKIINDAFGGYIGMSRRELWHLRNGGLTRDQLRSLAEKDKEYLLSVSDKNTLWKRPEFEYGGVPALSDIACDFAEDAIRSALPVKYSASKMRRLEPEDFVDLVLFFKEKAKEIAAAGKLDPPPEIGDFDAAVCSVQACQEKMAEFIKECENNDSCNPPYNTCYFQYEVLKNLRDAAHEYPRFVKNAIVAGIWEWKHPIIFDDSIRLEWLDEKARTGVKSFKRLAMSSVFSSYSTNYETLDAYRKFYDERAEYEKRVRKEKSRDRKKKTSPERPPITELVRSGAPEHKIEMDPDAFIAQFHFWGGEFGSWVSQNERKDNLVLAGNALADLAWVLNISEKEIGAGKLSFAFGARGRGGKRAAAAHYEPILNVINLTRENGAGCVAHEWGHYVDYKVLQPKNIGSPSMTWLTKRAPENEAEALSGFRAVIEKEEKMFATWFPSKEAFQEQVEKCGSKQEYIEFFRKGIEDYIKPKSFKNAGAWLRWVSLRASHEVTSIPTDFYRNALALDEGRKPYWSTDTELFARVVERYVLDLLEAKGMENNYLVTLYAYEIDPYPSAKEMKLFTPHLEKLFRENFRQREAVEAKISDPDRFSDATLSQAIEQSSLTFSNEQLSLF